MPIKYHGTSFALAIAMTGTPAAGTIRIDKGKGEFGGGFYTQDSPTNAHRRGQSQYPADPAILVLAIDDQRYHRLRIDYLTLNQAHTLNRWLHGAAKWQYRTTHDAIVGPLIKNPRIEQQKFQTCNALTLLNGLHTQRTPRR